MGEIRSAPAGVTAKIVAELTGFSISTIGRALADDPRISAETKAKVKRAADRCGYVGNVPARIMRGGTSNLIGLMLPDVRNDFYASIAQALTKTCGEYGRQVILSITNDDREAEARSIRELASGRAAGVIAVLSPQPKRESISLLKTMPSVQLLRRIPGFTGDWFGINDEAAIAEAVNHLVKLGHRRIAYVGGLEALSTGMARVRGFREALRACNVPQSEAREYLGLTTADFGRASFERLRRDDPAITAIISGSVHISLGLIAAVEESGISVPSQLSLIGFGDPEWFSWWRGGVTTIRPPTQQLAESCGQWFMRRLSNPDRAEFHDLHSAMIASSFIVRATVQECARPPLRLKSAPARRLAVRTEGRSRAIRQA